MTELLTVPEVAARLRVHVATVRRWTKAGRLPAAPLSDGTVRYRASDVEAFIASAVCWKVAPSHEPRPIQSAPSLAALLPDDAISPITGRTMREERAAWRAR